MIKGFVKKKESKFQKWKLYKTMGIDREDAIGFLKRVKEALQGMKWSLSYGTLLGAVRENNFIKGDIDVDTLLYFEHEDKLKEIVGRLKKLGCKAGIVGGYNQPFIQIYYKKVPGHITMARQGTFRAKFFEEKMRTGTIQGIEFPIPSNAENILTELYGDWKTPVSTEEWYKSH